MVHVANVSLKTEYLFLNENIAKFLHSFPSVTLRVILSSFIMYFFLPVEIPECSEIVVYLPLKIAAPSLGTGFKPLKSIL